MLLGDGCYLDYDLVCMYLVIWLYFGCADRIRFQIASIVLLLPFWVLLDFGLDGCVEFVVFG